MFTSFTIQVQNLAIAELIFYCEEEKKNSKIYISLLDMCKNCFQLPENTFHFRGRSTEMHAGFFSCP